MGGIYDFRRVFLILSILCESVGSGEASPIDVVAPLTNKALLHPYTHSQLFKDDVVSVFSALTDNSQLQLKILYDQNYADVINDIVIATRGTSSIYIYDYEGSEAQLRQILVPSHASSLLLALCSSQNIVKIFLMLREQRLESHLVDWLLMFANEDSQVEVITGLDGNIHEGTLVTLMVKGDDGKFDVFSTRLTTHGLVSFYHRGRIALANERQQFSSLLKRDDHHLYTDMNGRLMKVSVVNNYGLCTLGRELPDGSVEALSGIDISMVRALSQDLNFTFQTVYPPDKTYGNPLPNGSVTGMVGMAARREVGFSTCSIAISNLRETAVDFAYPYIRGSLGIFSRAPKEKNRALAVLSPFTLEVWLCLIASTIAIGPIVTIQSKVSKFYHLTKRDDEDEGRSHDLQWIAFNMFRNIVVQGNRINPKYWSQKFILFTWFTFCLLVSALYSGMLTAVLAIPEYETPVDSLTDLPRVVNEEGFTIGVLKDSANEYLFKEATGGIYKKTWGLFNHEDRSKSFVDGNTSGMNRVVSQNYVYIGFKLVCEILATKLGRSKIHVARETLFDHSLSVALPPGAPYQKVFSDKLMRMLEGGLMEKWKDDEFVRISQGISKESDEDQTYAITLTHLQAAFFVIILGSLLSSLVLVIENIVWYFPCCIKNG